MEFVQVLFNRELDYVRTLFPEKSEDEVLSEVIARVKKQLIAYKILCEFVLNQGL